MNEQDIRGVAENLLRSHDALTSQNVQSPVEISQSHSINTLASIRPEYVISEDLFAGQRLHGQMSNIRRFFCLFVTFDLLFTCLMWLICIVLNGDNIMTALKKQIYHYNVQTSLFDVVMVAIVRFFVLVLFYALLYINHWIVIAMSTSLTCTFLISKVFLYDWQCSNQPVFHVLLILISFVLSWGEAWFLDFRVLPQESHSSQYLIASPDSERTPLIRSYVQGLPSMYTESVGNFYSPLGSPEGSLHGFETINYPRRYSPLKLTADQESKYKTLGTNTLSEAWNLVSDPDWKVCKSNQEDDVVESMVVPKIGKLYKLTARLQIPPRDLLEEMFFKVDKIPQWNPDLLESYKVQEIDEKTDVCYQISAEGGGGIVSSRDFVILRYWDVVDDWYVIACHATDHPSIPKTEKYIRGEIGVSCLAMRELPDDPGSCEFLWLLNTDLKGWIPHYILHTALVTMLFDYIKNLRKYINTLRSTIGKPL